MLKLNNFIKHYMKSYRERTTKSFLVSGCFGVKRDKVFLRYIGPTFLFGVPKALFLVLYFSSSILPLLLLSFYLSIRITTFTPITLLALFTYKMC